MSDSPSEGEHYSSSTSWPAIKNEHEVLKRELSLCVQTQNDRLFTAVQAHFGSADQGWIEPFTALVGVDTSSTHHRRRSLQHQHKMTRQMTLSQRERDSLRRQIHRVKGVADAVQSELDSRTESIETLRDVIEAARTLARFYPNKTEIDLALKRGPISLVFGPRSRRIYRAVSKLNKAMALVGPKVSTLDLSMMDARHYKDILSWVDSQESKMAVLKHSVAMHRFSQTCHERNLEKHESAQRFIESQDIHSLDERVFRQVMDRCWRKEGVIEALKVRINNCPDMDRYIAAQARLAVIRMLSCFMETSDVERLPHVAKNESACRFVSEALACIASHEFSDGTDVYPEMSYFADLMKDKPRDSKLWTPFLWMVERLKQTHPRDIWLSRVAKVIASEHGNDSSIIYELRDAWGFSFAKAG